MMGVNDTDILALRLFIIYVWRQSKFSWAIFEISEIKSISAIKSELSLAGVSTTSKWETGNYKYSYPISGYLTPQLKPQNWKGSKFQIFTK